MDVSETSAGVWLLNICCTAFPLAKAQLAKIHKQASAAHGAIGNFNEWYIDFRSHVVLY